MDGSVKGEDGMSCSSISLGLHHRPTDGSVKGEDGMSYSSISPGRVVPLTPASAQGVAKVGIVIRAGKMSMVLDSVHTSM